MPAWPHYPETTTLSIWVSFPQTIFLNGSFCLFIVYHTSVVLLHECVHDFLSHWLSTVPGKESTAGEWEVGGKVCGVAHSPGRPARHRAWLKHLWSRWAPALGPPERLASGWAVCSVSRIHTHCLAYRWQQVMLHTYMGRCWKLLIEEWRNYNCALGPWFAQQCQVGWPRAHRFLPRPPGKGRGIWGKAGAGWGR